MYLLNENDTRQVSGAKMIYVTDELKFNNALNAGAVFAVAGAAIMFNFGLYWYMPLGGVIGFGCGWYVGKSTYSRYESNKWHNIHFDEKIWKDDSGVTHIYI